MSDAYIRQLQANAVATRGVPTFADGRTELVAYNTGGGGPTLAERAAMVRQTMERVPRPMAHMPDAAGFTPIYREQHLLEAVPPGSKADEQRRTQAEWQRMVEEKLGLAPARVVRVVRPRPVALSEDEQRRQAHEAAIRHLRHG